MRTPIKLLISCLPVALTLAVMALGQTPPPSTDIFLIDVTQENGRLKFGVPINITDREGYDNQPMFLPDGRGVLYTSFREDRQTDIYLYDTEKRLSRRVTATSESEYSPTVMQGGKFISVVRVEADSTQRLWKFPLGGGSPSLVLEKIKPVGYHAWVDELMLMLFVLGSPNTLQLVDARTEETETIAENIGRTLQRIPGQDKISFVQRSGDKMTIKAFDVKTRSITSLIETLPGSEYYVWTPEGVLLMGKDSKLFGWDSRKGGEWQELADLSKYGIKDITRLAVSPRGDRIALVAARPGTR
ncbi:MAG: hypothetical protein L0229_06130 [Blastocatellia bacterium]|nr:hypothetical protein [Blastocatellia bacterium]